MVAFVAYSSNLIERVYGLFHFVRTMSNDLLNELEENGVSVQRGACTKKLSAECFDYISKNLEKYLALPGTMNSSSQKRHFLHVSTAPKFNTTHNPGHRSEFVLPIESQVDSVLRCILSGTVGTTLMKLLGENAELSEITAIPSEPGAKSQAMHSDGNWGPLQPRTMTMFLALHNIQDEAMGPTYFCPKTHVPSCFPNNEWVPPTPTLDRGPVWYTLCAGDAVLMHSTTWHYGGANISDRNRVLLSFSFVAGEGGEDKLCLRNFL